MNTAPPAPVHRIVSLLPSATELVCALGLESALVGISHECDYPPTVTALPRVTRTKIAHDATSREIDQQVREELAGAKALYSLELDTLRALAPELIVTQSLCDVCAVGAEEVDAALCRLPGQPRLFNLQPERLADIFGCVRTLGEAAGVPAAAAALEAALAARVEAVRERSAGLPAAARPRVALVEWLDPWFDAGHWNPELVEIAGGVPVCGRVGEPSTTLEWEKLRGLDPDVIFIACCGFDVPRTLVDLPTVRALPGWSTLKAVRDGRVYVTDGNAYFNRPGPRIVDSLEILAHALHPGHHPLPLGLVAAITV
jgi:iron complex transport system substrate-binding protein